MTRLGLLAFISLTYAAPLLLPALAWATARVMSAYLYLAFDTRTRPGEVTRVCAYGFFPLALGQLVTAGLLPFCGPDCNPFNPLASNLGFFLDPTATSVFWYELGRGLDLVSLWTLLAIAWGLEGLTQEPARYLAPPLATAWLALLAVRAWLLA